MTYNLILRKGISFLLILALIFSGFFIAPKEAQAETQTIKTIKTEEFDDLAYYDVWKHEDGTWQKGIKPGSSASQTYTITESVVPEGAKILSVTGTFNYNFGGKDWDWAVPAGTVTGVSYEIANGQIKNGALADLTYTVSTTLTTNNNGIYGWNLKQPWQAANVEGYRYYIPAHFEITYEITETVEIPDLPAPEEITAVIEAPASAKTGESFSVADGTLVGEETILASSTLYKSVDGGTKQLVAEWEGTGNKGENTGGSISETYDIPCKIEYELVAETESGLTDTATKTVIITDGREIDGQADLELDKYTYEGHPADAKDYTEFTVDGERYSAKRAYQEGIARNSYRVQGGTARKDGYNAIVTFPNKGTYPVTLNVTVNSTGARLTDTENIEVRKTPYVEGGLGGVQKQNRKQTLDFRIATYPDKPITDWHITIKDEKTGETAIIDSENPKFVGNSIKTREAQVIIEDKYWTTIRIEFLTKYPDYDQTGEATRKFYYGIKVTDSKGDSDTESDYFDVAPDLPPVPQIGMQTTFLRNPGTNTAALEAEDISSSDGDQLQRSWYVADHNQLTGAMGAYSQAEEKDGYENLAFGTNQKIGWHKEGVGKETVKLHVKDVWIEPTLEEYITADDYLSAETTAQTEVLNIAPVVSIEPLDTYKAYLNIIVKRSDLQWVKQQTNSIQAKLIESGIDAGIGLIPAVENQQEEDIVKKRNLYGYVSQANAGKATVQGYDRTYLTVNPAEGNGEPNIELMAYDNGVTNKKAWTFNLDSKQESAISIAATQDEKYLIYGSKSYVNNMTQPFCLRIFNAETGSLLYSVNTDEVYFDEAFSDSSNTRIYLMGESGINEINVKTGKITKLIPDAIYQPRMSKGKVGFVVLPAKMKGYLGYLNLETGQIEKHYMPILHKQSDYAAAFSLECTGWSEDGKVAVQRSISHGPDGGKMFWVVDTKTEKQTWGNYIEDDDYGESFYLVPDAEGNADYFVFTYGYKGNTSYYSNIKLYQAECDNKEAEEIARWGSGKAGSVHLPGVGYYDREAGKIVLQEISMLAKTWIYDIASDSWSEVKFLGINPWLDNVKKIDDRVLTYHDSVFSSNWYKMGTEYEIKTTYDSSAYENYVKYAYAEAGVPSYIVKYDIGIDLPNLQTYAEKIGTRILDFAEELSEIGKTLKRELENGEDLLILAVPSSSDKAGLSKSIHLDEGKEYEYSYDMDVVSGSAVDIFNYSSSVQSPASGTNIYREKVYEADFTGGEEAKDSQSNIVSYSGGYWFYNSNYNENGWGFGCYNKDDDISSYPKITVYMENDGYVQLNMAGSILTSSLLVYVDGKDSRNIGTDTRKEYNGRLYLNCVPVINIYLDKGTHTIELKDDDEEISTWNEDNTVITRLTVYYLYKNDTGFTKAAATSGASQTIKGSFKAGREIEYAETRSADVTLYSISELISKGWIQVEAWSNGYYTYPNNGQNVTAVYTGRISSKGKYVCKFTGNLTAPANTILVCWYDGNSFIIEPGEKKTIGFNVQKYDGPPYVREHEGIKNFLCAVVPVGTIGATASDNFTTGNSPVITKSYKQTSSAPYPVKELSKFYMIKPTSASKARLIQCVFGNKEKSEKISFDLAGSSALKKVGISNLKITCKNTINGRTETYLRYEDFLNSESGLASKGWVKSTGGNGYVGVERYKVEKEPEQKLVYKKGELVKYSINYSDYENDPSKASQGYSYWIYAHEPFNDGEHSQAAIVYDEDGNIIKICGKTVEEALSAAGIELESAESLSMDKAIEAAVKLGGYTLTESIPRFYVDGKYTVYHWEYDDTSRGTVSSGYPLYDKASNIAELTFYIEGSATAPWITGISTSPAKVKENEYFSINIGMDDLEKDVLSLTTEVYKDKKKIFTHRQKNIYPLDSSGNKAANGILENGSIAAGEIKYLVINTGALPDKAQAGKYEVVCTVRDQTGAGLGYYSLTVVSEGKITGEVYHTEQWDINRKKYNVAKFGDEINTEYSYADYLKLKTPRKRGTNVFWSGEKFMLQAAVASTPTKVTCEIKGTKYSTVMKSTGRKNVLGETIYEGSLWENSFINKWGSKKPEELTFVFTAYYSGGTSKNHECRVIVDNMDSYWKLHRVF